MKREIKFRVFNKTNNKLIYSDDAFFCFYDGRLIERDGVGGSMCDDDILMQYTGLHDKNGKEIYEGDILKGKFKLEEVDGYIYLSLSDIEKEKEEKIFIVDDLFYLYTNPVPDDIEVIGNVYENENLLLT